jgi:hypothetical protein
MKRIFLRMGTGSCHRQGSKHLVQFSKELLGVIGAMGPMRQLDVLKRNGLVPIASTVTSSCVCYIGFRSVQWEYLTIVFMATRKCPACDSRNIKKTWRKEKKI